MENELNKQTAVEWLFEQIARRQGSILHTIPFYNENQDLLIQAKEMEKQQIKDAYFIGGHDIKNNRYKGMHEYYEQTYGGNK